MATNHPVVVPDTNVAKEPQNHGSNINYDIDDVPSWYLCIFMALQKRSLPPVPYTHEGMMQLQGDTKHLCRMSQKTRDLQYEHHTRNSKCCQSTSEPYYEIETSVVFRRTTQRLST
ncbi:uncharacterized protein LOC131677910 isoform X4 [Topomyia yanbarensis]|uniref:uncharacterized protein LOC131677910 isoform X4 n=1 Tax=Topomyia yanbarensis TaxID=2498891 RepID=UPI00273BF761|nr:uncharacterized protein LOC131677910 isoform X4 [Topomyia yanbarensis]